MSTFAEISERRLEKVLYKDKKQNPNQILNLLKSDLYVLFNNYMVVNNIDLKFELNNGVYSLLINAKANRIKNFCSL